MNDYLKILFVVIVSLIAGAYMHKCQSPPGNIPERTECATDTIKVFDTIPYLAPTPQSELAIGSRRYSLPKYYFIASDVAEEPRSSISSYTNCDDDPKP